MENKGSIASAQLSKLKVSEPQIFCKSGYKINRMCTNPNCLTSLVCSDINCLHCGVSKHPTCLIVSLPGITTLLNKRMDVYKELISRVFCIDEDFIYSLQESRNQHINKSYLSRDPRYQMVIDEIYNRNNSSFLRGLEAKDFYQKLLEQSNVSDYRLNQLAQTYRAQLNKLFLSLVKVKQWIYEQFLNEFDLNSQILLKQNKEDKQKVQFIREVLDNPKELYLLYRGSQQNFSAEMFHQKCGNLTDTLTIVKTEFGKTIAGYSKYPWNTAKEDWVHDAQKQTFLLSLDLKIKMPPLSRYKLIYCSQKCGPTFGSGPDLKIVDRCHKNQESFCNFPSTFNTQDLKFQKNEQTLTLLTGSPLGYFRVLQYEVFRIISSDFKLIDPSPTIEDKSPFVPDQKKMLQEDANRQGKAPLGQKSKKKDSDSFCSIQ